MAERARELADLLVDAYRPWVRRRLSEQGIAAPPGLEAALEEGERWLEGELERLLDLPFLEQPRGPLEVFQQAMRFPTRVLEDGDVEPRRRDPAAVRALPGDLYGLAPASSRELGEEVWEAHLGWGAAKAQAVAPLVRERLEGGSPPGGERGRG